MDTVLYVIGGTGLFFAGMFQAGKLSMRIQKRELEQIKTALEESNIENEILLQDINNQLETLGDYSFFVKREKFKSL
tara:strand:- start:4847 stop:5077 length:231 start_codon:yes stop_codon:yes gene_type:complete